MGVLACSVRTCPNIMCDTYIPNVGYICYFCQERFKKYVVYQNIQLNSYNVQSELIKFLDIDHNNYGDNSSDDGFDIDEYFNTIKYR